MDPMEAERSLLWLVGFEGVGGVIAMRLFLASLVLAIPAIALRKMTQGDGHGSDKGHGPNVDPEE